MLYFGKLLRTCLEWLYWRWRNLPVEEPVVHVCLALLNIFGSEKVFSLSGDKESLAVASGAQLTASLPSICFIEGTMLASTHSDLWCHDICEFHILLSILNFLQGVFSYLFWFFIRLRTVSEVGWSCCPVQAEVESGKFPVCYTVSQFMYLVFVWVWFVSISVIKLIAALERFTQLVFTVAGNRFTSLGNWMNMPISKFHTHVIHFILILIHVQDLFWYSTYIPVWISFLFSALPFLQ